MRTVRNYEEYNLNYKGFIYETTCLVNGMKYIGRHSGRDLNDDYLGSPKNPQFWEDLKKYGRENFVREILDPGPFTFEESCLKEIEYQKKVQADINPLYYNLSIFSDMKLQVGELNPMYQKTYVTNGSEELVIDKSLVSAYELLGYRIGRKDTVLEKLRIANTGKIFSKATREKMSLSAHNRPPIREETREKFRNHILGDKNPMRNPEVAQKMSITITGEGNPFYGKHHTEVSRRKMSESVSGERNPCYGKRLMNNGVEQKYILESEILSYESNGWTLGKLRK